MKAEIKEVDVPTERLVLTLDLQDARDIANDILEGRTGTWALTELKAVIATTLAARR